MAKPEPQSAPDPLADLRQDAGPVLPSLLEGKADAVVIPEPGVLDVRPMVTEEMHRAMVSEAVAAWHQDPTSQGFLHGGGPCGCRYIAALALSTAVPVMTEADLEERELETVPSE